MEQDTTQFKNNKKNEILARALLYGTPEKTDEVYKALGEVEFSSELLMYACRYKGLPYVKVLVENGANFNHTYEFYDKWQGKIRYLNLSSCILEFDEKVPHWIVALRFPETYRDEENKLTLLGFEERAEVLHYLFEHKEQAKFEPSDALYYSILADDEKMYDELKKLGAVLSEKHIDALTVPAKTKPNLSYEWLAFTWCFRTAEENRLAEVLRKIIKEVGEDKLLCYDDAIYYHMNDRRHLFYDGEVFSLILEHFDQKQIKRKIDYLKYIILNEYVSALPIVEKYGWLKGAKKRDDLIAFAVQNGKTESSAWLLEYKHRTADLVKEAADREKKILKELNAAPDSVTMLKKIWNYKKLEDGTLMITGYKGRSIEITVPEKIGKSIVTAVGDYAFSPMVPSVRINYREEIYNTRCRISKVVLPETVKTIGSSAFCNCIELESIVMEGVCKIGNAAFCDCQKLKSIKLPDTLTEIGNAAFWDCYALESVTIPKSVKEMKNKTFYNCHSLKNVVFAEPSSSVKIRSESFANCTSLESVIIGEGVTEIGQRAFIGCEKLNKVTLPKTVKKIVNYTDTDRDTYTPFSYSPDVTVYVYEGSYGEKYCMRNNIKFTYITGE